MISQNYLLLLIFCCPLLLTGQDLQICNNNSTGYPVQLSSGCYASETIESGGNICTPIADETLVAPYSDVQFYATESITLNAGFKVASGGQFVASIVEDLNAACPPQLDNADYTLINVYDRWGNKYDFTNVQTPPVNNPPEVCEAGLFKLYFMDVIENTNHGFDEDALANGTPLGETRQQIICQMFTHLSSFLQEGSHNARVNVKIRTSGNDTDLDAGLLGFASSHYAVPRGTTSAYLDGEVWKTIKTQRDSWLGYPPALLPVNNTTPTNAGYFHGEAQFNFLADAPYYHLDLNTLAPQGVSDFYTLTLHEAMHLIGFASLIDANGSSRLTDCAGCYSRFDEYLKYADTNAGVISEINTTDDRCDMPVFNAAVEDLGTGCNTIIYDGISHPPTGETQVIYSPNAYQAGSSLSHLECAESGCPFAASEHVMTYCNAGGAAFTRRHPSQAEADILCDLGYRRNDTWGEATNNTIFQSYQDCSGQSLCVPTANNSYQTMDGTPYQASGREFVVRRLTSDPNDIACVNVLSPSPEVGTITRRINNGFGFTPAPGYVGWVTIGYIAQCANGLRGNLGYVFIEVVQPPPCDLNDCNLICGGDFEDIRVGSYYARATNSGVTPDMYRLDEGDGMTYRLNETGSISMNTDYIVEGLPTTFPPHSTDNLQYIGMVRLGSSIEKVGFELNQALDVNNSYRLSFWARAAKEDAVIGVRVVADDLPPCSNSSSDFSPGATNECDFSTHLITEHQDVVRAEWKKYEIVFNPAENFTHLFLHPTDHNTYLLVDDIELTVVDAPIIQTTTIVDNPQPCSNEVITIDYTIQLASEQATTTNTTPIALTLDVPTGFTVMGGDFAPDGTYTIPANTLNNGTLLQLQTNLQLSATELVGGTAYTIALEVANLATACVESENSVTTVEITPISSKLFVHKTASNFTPVPNEIVDFSIQVCNTSMEEINNVLIEDILPAEFTLVDANDFNYDNANRRLSTTIPTLSATFNSLPYCLTYRYTAQVNPVTECAVFAENCVAVSVTADCQGQTSDCLTLAITAAGAGVEQVVGTSNETLTFSQAINSGQLAPNSTSDATIFLSGTLALERLNDYTFTNTTFIMNEGAAIIVGDGTRLEIHDSTLGNCGFAMWRGITVRTKGTLVMDGTTTISDAEYAVQLEDKSTVTLTDVTFDRNYIGIYVPKLATNEPSTIFLQANNNTFDCTDMLNPPYAGQTPALGLPAQNDWALAGIWLEDVTGLNIPKNTFRSVSNGIVSHRTQLNVNQAFFKNIPKNNFYSLSGHGIYATGDGYILNQVGAGRNLVKANFDNCFRGIRCEGTAARISNNTMKNMGTGISLVRDVAFGTRIEANDIFAETGIFLGQNDPNGSIQILNNYLETQHHGIWLAGSVMTTPESVIQQNEIHLKNTGSGLYLLACEEIKLLNNAIYLDAPTSNDFAINIEGGEDCKVQENDIFGSGTSGGVDKNIGIRVINAANTLVCCNVLEDVRVGVKYEGMSAALNQFKGNQFVGDIGTGMLMTGNAILGQQIHQGNTWEGSFENVGALDQGGEDGAEDSQIFIDQNLNRDFIPSTFNPGTGWFIPDNNSSTTYYCSSPCQQSQSISANNDLFHQIATENLYTESSQYQKAIQWMANYYLYSIIRENAGIELESNILENFYVQAQNHSWKDYYNLQFTLDSLLVMDERIKENLSDKENRIINSLNDISVIDDLLNNTDANSHSVLIEDKKFVLDNLLNLTYDIQLIQSDIENQRVSDIDNLLAVNEIVEGIDIIEENRKIINRLRYFILQNDLEFDEIQIEQLKNIANQCPLEGGNSVFHAQAILSAIQDYEYDSSCSNIGYRSFQQNNHHEKQNFNIYPNPAREQFTIVMPTELDKTIVIYNLLGQEEQIFDVKEATSVFLVKTSKLSNGIYVCKIKSNGRVEYTKKILILK